MIKNRSLNLYRVFSILLLLSALVTAGAAQEPDSSGAGTLLPAPTGFVNDFAGVMDAATKQQTEARLKAFKEKTGIEIAVAVVKTTGTRDIFDYSLTVARDWKIGSKADDNPGALLFVAIDDRKYFTQISRDLEDELPDGVAGSLQRQFLVPEFKKGNYAKGISDTVEAYIAAIEFKLDPANTPPPAGITDAEYKTPLGDTLIRACCCLAGIIILIAIFASRRSNKSKNDHNRWGGGGFGGGGSALPWILWAGSVGSSGSSSSSSSWDWGGSSSGGSDWGGFGGGGDFGGGGAGGDW